MASSARMLMACCPAANYDGVAVKIGARSMVTDGVGS